ncbi:MAG: hypothetical protein BGO55_15340 [Sphingobacteriales bacterium 50-39]|nr:hypothetical protein [Sphingobacteriales bacterium]OJW54745.1 MAG: hypothetical protein BGO55_15340 [Sphingobacteriales bacterium 50-39]
MAGLGKKILSAFVEVNPPDAQPAASDNTATPHEAPLRVESPSTDSRMVEYFDKLFSDANIPGPDYFEFSKMVAALKAIPDEFTRFSAAFAGLQVQGLTKEKLLSTAEEYLKVLDTDAAHFHSTVEAALQEKVQDKKAEAEQKTTRIQALAKEISELQSQIASLQAEITDSEQKITGRSGDYTAESTCRKQQIAADIEKIKQYIRQQ